MNDVEYSAMCDRLIADFKAHKDKYLTADDVTRHLLPGSYFEEMNRKVIIEAIAHLKFTATRFQTAMRRRLKDIEQEERQQQRQQQQQQRQQTVHDLAAQCFGGDATDARDAVWRFCDHNAVVLNYDGTCTMAGKPSSIDAVETAIILAAEKMRYTLGSEKIMTMPSLRLAVNEFVRLTKENSKRIVWDKIASTDAKTAARVLADFRTLCNKLFTEPAFAEAALRKFMWQVKRKMQGLYIEHLHFVVLQGGTGTGKTEFCRELLKPITAIVSPASIAELVDAKNFQLLEMFVGFADELAKADRADVNTLKNLVTGDYSTARVHYSHHSQRTKINLTLLGTADKPVASVIFDQAGMRRFVQVDTKPRQQIDALGLDWQAEVVGFDMLNLWRAVDHTTADPLMSAFEALVKHKQEAMRSRDNVEAWLEQFDPHRFGSHVARQQQQGDTFEYRANELYTNSFRRYEDEYHPSTFKTSITKWGIRFKSLIDAGCLPQWTWRSLGNVVLYRYQMSNVVDITPSPQKGLVVATPRR